MFTFRLRYFLLTLALFSIEVLIALYVNDSTVRPYVGDYLVVMLVYGAVRTVLRSSVKSQLIGVLLFAYAVEVLQYFRLIAWLGWQDNRLARMVLGSHFEWVDMLAYTLGVITIWFLERWHAQATKARYQSV